MDTAVDDRTRAIFLVAGRAAVDAVFGAAAFDTAASASIPTFFDEFFSAAAFTC